MTRPTKEPVVPQPPKSPAPIPDPPFGNPIEPVVDGPEPDPDAPTADDPVELPAKKSVDRT